MHQAAEPPAEPQAKPQADQASSRASRDFAQSSQSFGARSLQMNYPLVGAGAMGAAAALLMIMFLWLVGALPSGQDASSELASRLASIEKQLHALANRPVAPSADPQAIADLGARLQKLENAQLTPRPPVTDPVVLGRLAATENAVKSLSDNMTALSRRADAIDPAIREVRSQLEATAAGLSELKSTMRAAAVGSDRASRLALAAGALRAAVERGEPFAGEIAVVRLLISDPGVLAPLEPFAAAGVPNNAALARDLAAIMQPVRRQETAPPRDSGLLDRLQANAERLVRIRRVDEAEGDDHGAIIARAQSRAARGDIAGAIEELAKLPAAVRAPAQAWIDKVEARDRAIEISRNIAADAVTALKLAP
jgi:hypothetical protein